MYKHCVSKRPADAGPCHRLCVTEGKGSGEQTEGKKLVMSDGPKKGSEVRSQK